MTPARRVILGLALSAVLGAPPALAADVIAIKAETLHTSGPRGTIANGLVLVREGKIAAVGTAREVDVPRNAKLMSAAVVTPGLIDTQSVAGLWGMFNVEADRDADEATGPNQAGLRAIDAFNPREPMLGWLLQHGVTVVQAGPGEANPISGQAGVFKTAAGTVGDVTLRFPSAMLFALGEPPKGTYAAKGQMPSTRMGTAAVIRNAFVEANQYRREWEKYERDLADFAKQEARPEETAGEDDDAEKKPEPPARDLTKEALVQVLEKTIPAIFVARREDDILTAVRLAEEFGFELQLADAAEAYLIADQLAARHIPVHAGPVIERAGSHETMNLSFEAPAILASRGVPVTFRSGFEGYVPRVHVVLFEAALAGAYGLGFDRALHALTIDAARLLDIDDRVGSLEVGKDADLVLYDGDPFEYTSHIEAVIVDGAVAHHRHDAPDPRWQPLTYWWSGACCLTLPAW